MVSGTKTIAPVAGPITVTATAGTLGPTDYATLKAAFDAINAGTHQGVITLSVVGDTTETASALLQASGSGPASYSSISIKPSGGAARTISGNIAAPLIYLLGADNVTIDGLNTGGDALTISNTNAGSAFDTCTILFINDASNNTIQNCAILGSETPSGSGGGFSFGTITFFTGTVTGNDGNVINQNNIGAAGGNLPEMAIDSNGTTTSGIENSGNQITNNNIFDFYNASPFFSAGIDLNGGSTDWTITGNSFYQTATRTGTGSNTHYGIWINTGNNHNVSNNFIGGSAANASGSPWTMAGNVAQTFYGIYLNVGSATATSVQNNTISNFSLTTSSSANGIFTGINITGGKVNAGTVTGNTIGSGTGTGSITTTTSTSGSVTLGINATGTSTNATISNNTIGSITAGATGTLSGCFTGIQLSSSSTTYSVSNNTIGSATTANSTNASNNGTSSTGQFVNGINSSSSGTVTITGNTIANLNNNYTGIATGGQVRGIVASAGVNTITGNTIRNLSTTSKNTSVTSPSAVGISESSALAAQTVSQNTIHSMSNSAGGATFFVIEGILIGGGVSSTNNLISRNFIHSFSSNSTAAFQFGIYIPSASSSYQNNIIRLGIDASGASITTSTDIIGILKDTTSSSNSFYFNSVFVGGSNVVSSSPTFSFWSGSGANDVRNNIFVNLRSNASGSAKNYSYFLGGTTSLTSDYNIYFVDAAHGGVLASIDGGTTDLNSLLAIQSATSQDTHSLNADPLFKTPNGTSSTVDLHITSPSINGPSPASNSGVAIGGITNDFDNDTRNNPPDIGADEYDQAVTYASSGSLTAGTYTNIIINGPAVVTLTGNITVTGSITVNSGAKLDCGGFTISGAGSFTLNSGGTLGIGSVNGITSGTTVSGNIQLTGGRTYSGGATYAYDGASDQAVGNGLPSPVANLTIANASSANTVTGNSGQSVTGTLDIQKGIYSSHSDYTDVLIGPTGTLSLSADITVSGNWTNNGSFASNGFAVTFNGASTQSIGGSNTTLFVTLNISGTNVQLTHTGDVTSTLHVTGGIFDLNGQNLAHTGNITVDSGATFKDLGSAGTITMSGSMTNSGTVQINAHGTTCGDADDISIVSEGGGQRTWSGTGSFQLGDVSVANQGGTTPITVHDGTNAGGNGPFWFFLGCTSSAYVWTPNNIACAAQQNEWGCGNNWNPTRTTPDPGDLIIFKYSVTTSPMVLNVPTQQIAAMRLINDVDPVNFLLSVTLKAQTLPAGTKTLTVSGATGNDLSVPSGTALNLAGTEGLQLSLTSGSTGSVGGQMTFAEGPHQLLATGGSTVTFLGTGAAAANRAYCTTLTNYPSSSNPFGTGTGGNGSNDSIIFSDFTTYTHNNGASPFGSSSSEHVAKFNPLSEARFYTANGFSANGRTYGDLVIGDGTNETIVSDTGTGNFTFYNLTVNNVASPGTYPKLTFTGTDPSQVTIKGNITSTGGTGNVQDINLAGGPTNGVVIDKTGGGTISFTDANGNSRGLEFDSNARITTNTTLSLGRKLLMGTPLNPPTYFLSVPVDATLSGGSTGYVVGKLLKNFDSGHLSQTFNVGDVVKYSPVVVSNVSLSGSTGNLTINARTPKLPAVSGANALARYWQIANSGLSSANLAFHYPASDVTGTESFYKFFRYSGGTFTRYNVSSLTTTDLNDHIATLDGVSQFSDWTLAEPSAVNGGTVSFASAPYTTTEGNGVSHPVTITVNRASGSDGAIDVAYATSDGTATAGSDYVTASGSLHWNAGETGSRQFDITVNEDGTYEANETVNITLSTTSVGVTLGAPNPTTLTITNDDPVPANAALVVNTTDDNDFGACVTAHCSLREAINAANSLPDANTINFAIPSADARHFYYADDAISGHLTQANVTTTSLSNDGAIGNIDPDWPHSWWSIMPATGLPSFTQPAVLNGYSQTGAQANTNATGAPNAVLRIEVDGESAGSATMLRADADGVTMKGIAVNRAAGVGFVLTHSNAWINGNYSGTDISGSLAEGNSNGVVIIPGSTASNNLIGSDANGTNDPAERNLISGNTVRGVLIRDAGSSNNTIAGNYIGTNANGTGALANGQWGIQIQSGAHNNLIGGTNVAARNVISGNQSAGILLTDSTTSGNTIQGNYIGVGADGTTSLGNTGAFFGDGVYVNGLAHDNVIGGPNVGEGNVIANNSGAGVNVNGYANNSSIRGNSIFNNGGLGIDLCANCGAGDGVTANDTGDGDDGGNHLQNFPVITSATVTGTTYKVAGSFNSTPSTSNYTLEFFKNTTCDGSGNGEGQTYLGNLTGVSTDGSGNATFTFISSTPFAINDVITATATDSLGNTSEFSACATAVNGNTNPTITAATGLSRQQGSPSSNSIIATVNDTESGPNGVTVSVTSANPSNGVTISNIQNANDDTGHITADVVAACDATDPATFTLQASDGSGGTATDTLTITVAPNSAPTLTHSSPHTVTEGNSLTISPATGPSDNGTVSSIVVQDAGGYPGSISVNNATGVVTVSNAVSPGSYTITIRATDNCAATTDATFTLTVNAAACDLPPPNMVSWYPGDGNADDVKGGHNGTLQNGATFGPGKVDQAFSFDGVNQGVLIGSGALPNISASGQFTVDLWLNPSNVNGIHTMFQRERSYLYIENGVIKSFVGGNATDTGITAPVGQWTHAALTYNNGAVNVYVNGVLAVSSTQALGDQSGFATSIGYDARLNDEYFSGLIDEVEFFDGALSDSDIFAIYNASFAGKCRTCTTPPSGMVSWYPAEGNANDIADSNNGAVSASFAPGKVGQAFSFDGDVNHYVDVPYAANLGSTTGTWDFWIKTTQTTPGPAAGVMSEANATSSLNGITVFQGSGAISVDFKDGTGSVGTVNGARTINDGQWHHVAITFQAGGTANLYIDGVPDGSASIGTFTFDALSLRLGRHQDSFWTTFAGQLDEVEVFNRVLSASEVAAIADAGNAGKCHTSTLQFSAATYQATEGTDANATITVTRTGAHDTPATVHYATSAGANTVAGHDYTETSDTLNFAAGEVSKTFNVPILQDNSFSNDHTVNLTLSLPTGAGVTLGSPNAAVLTIHDTDDNPPSFAIDDVPQNEGDSSTTSYVFTVTKTGATDLSSSVEYTTVDGSATTSDNDYQGTNGTLTFAAGETQKTITVLVNGDTKYENNETFKVHLSNPSHATISQADGTGTITNDDAPPSFSIDNVSHLEGNSGTVNYMFTVTKTGSTALSSSVDFATADNTAKVSDNDYVANSNTLNFGPTDTTATITVLVNGDTNFEGDETFFVNLSNPFKASISQAQGTGTILNDECDPFPTGMVSWWSAQNNANDIYGTNNGAFNGTPAYATGKVGQAFSFNGSNYVDVPDATTLHLTTAFTLDAWIYPTDFSANPVIFSKIHGPGTLAYEFDVSQDGKLVLFISPDGSTNDSRSTAAGVVTTNQWQHVAVTFNAGSAQFFVNGSPVGGPVTFNDTSVFPGTDHLFIGSNGSGANFIGLIDEAEVFDHALTDTEIANLATASGAGKCHTSTIQFSSATYEATEGTDANAVITVTRVGAHDTPASVHYATSAGTATPGQEYTETSGDLNFAAGEVSKPFNVPILEDNSYAHDTTVNLTLSSTAGDGVSLTPGSPGTAVLTIHDTNDDKPSFSIDNVTHNEGDPGNTTSYDFTVTKTGATELSSSVDFTTMDGTASIGDNDYQFNSGTLTFLPGETTKQITVLVYGDGIYESNETFTVHLSNPTEATISQADGTGTLTNDDVPPTLSISANPNSSLTEGNSGTKNFSFTVTRSGNGTEVDATVHFTTADGGIHPATGGACGSAGVDYNSESGSRSVTVGASDTSNTFTISVCGDTTYEYDEQFLVNLVNPVDATIGTSQATGTIKNDDKPPTTLTVNTTDDVDNGACFPSHCSLREAINAANFNSDLSTINFAIPETDLAHVYYRDDGTGSPNGHVTNDAGHIGFTSATNDTSIGDIDPDWPHSWWMISPQTPLPSITFGLTLDGYTQTGAAANTLAAGENAVMRIEINGAGAGVSANGLTSSSSTLKGLVVNRFTNDGISLGGSNTLNGNFIGTDVSGTLALANGGSGVSSSSFSNLIGGSTVSTPDVRNVISGNVGDGVSFGGGNSNTVQGNFIGTKANGTSALPNGGNGIAFSGGSVFCTVGGTNAGEGNTIAFNGADGVHVDATAGIGQNIRANSIFSNGTTANHLGIDLGPDGVTANDPQDADTGPNNLQNFPVIKSAVVGTPNIISGTLISAASQTFTIDLYANPTCDASGNGEGKMYLGSTTTTTDSNGLGGFRFTPATLNVADQVTATATDSTGNTSEFSACFQATGFNSSILQFVNAPYTDGENGADHTKTITVSRTGGSTLAVDVTYTTSDGSATAGSDYVSTTGTLHWNNGETGNKTFDITVKDDTIYEGDETVNIKLSNPTNGATIAGTNPTTLTIQSDDAPPSFSIDDVSLNEGDSATTPFTFTIKKSGNSTEVSASVRVDTADGTATAPSDYAAITNQVVTFAPGEDHKTVTVSVNGDTIAESPETFTVNLSAATNATISDGQGVGTIGNDDNAPSFSINDVTHLEGNSGTTDYVFTVTKNGATAFTTNVNFATANGTTNPATGGGACGGSVDYEAKSGTLTFPATGPGSTSQTITIHGCGDTNFEPDETFNVVLSNPLNATISRSPGIGTIQNDDVGVEDIQNKSTNENTQLQFPFNVSGGALVSSVTASSSNTTLVPNNPANIAVSGSGGTRTLTINPAANQFGTSTITVTVNSTSGSSSSDTFVLTVSSGGTLQFSTANFTVAENVSGGNATITVTRTGGSAGAASVKFATSDGTATAPSDYTSTSTTVNFADGDASPKTVNVPIINDSLAEPDETVNLTLSNVSGSAALGSQSTAILTITNDDAQGGIISFDQSNYSVNEADGFVTITVTRTGDTSRAATVDYATPDDSEIANVPPCATASGIAQPRCDFTTALGTLAFAAGETTSKTFVVLISQDNIVEGPETLQLTLSNLTGGAVFGANSTATLTINDDASEPAANPIDDPENFVRQHYHDFLNREPDPPGLVFWKGNITECGSDAHCVEVKRVNVSAAFYLSIEFQGTGYLVERMYKAAYGDVVKPTSGGRQIPVPVVRFIEFLRDTQKIGHGVIVNQGDWQQQLNANKDTFAAAFVQRTKFSNAYPTTLSPQQFVDQLFTNTGVTPSASDRQSAIDEFGSGATNTADLAARGRALRKVAENSTFSAAEFNRAFVLMQYFGYLRRNPDAQDTSDYSGWEFWLNKLNQFNGSFVNADMVKAFIISGEYLHRFGR